MDRSDENEPETGADESEDGPVTDSTGMRASDPDGSVGDPSAGNGADGAETDEGPIRRRTLIRLLVGLGIGIPVLIELRTLSHLVRSWLGGDGDDSGGDGNGTTDAESGTTDGSRNTGVEPGTENGSGTGTTGRTATSTGSRRVSVGEELLPATPQTETVTAAALRTDGSERQFVVRVDVTNDADVTYELRLGRLRTVDGRVVDGGGAERIGPSRAATVTGEWSLPAETRPKEVFVIAITENDDGTRTLSRRIAIDPASEPTGTAASRRR